MKNKLLRSIVTFLILITSQNLLQAQCAISNVKYTQVSSGQSFNTALKEDGTLWSWGKKGDGKLGQGSLTPDLIVPTQIETSTSWAYISTGRSHTVALKNDGSLWSWGNNDYGKLGNGTTTDVYVPTQIGTGTNWIAVSANQSHNIGVKSDGTLWAWGANSSGKLGDGTTINRLSPIQIGSDTTWSSKISTGSVGSFAIKTDGTLWAWGSNLFGQIAAGSTPSINVPTQLGTETWTAISAGSYFGFGIKSNGTLWSWGYNAYGQLGDGTTVDKTTPVQIGTSSDWSKIQAGDYHACAIKNNGNLWAWGNNGSGRLGDGTTTHRNTPVLIGGSWKEVFAGGDVTHGIKDSSVSLWGWGRRNSGYFGNLGGVAKTPVRLLSMCFIKLSNDSCSHATGKAYVLASHGEPPYTYQWKKASTIKSTTDTLVNATAYSSYSVTVTDASGSSLSATFSIDPIGTKTYETIIKTACHSFTSPSGKYTWTTNGYHKDTIPNAAGCDSIITFNLSILNGTTQTISASACDSYTSPSTNYTWTSSGIYYDTLTNIQGCDSIIVVDLTINNNAHTFSASACNSYTSPSTNYVWTTSGIYTDTLNNVAGCDSVITVNLTIYNPSTQSISATACDSYTSPSTNHIWTSSGTYSDTMTNALGCDSILTINLTIQNSATNSISATACDSYTSPSTNYTWTASGTYTDTLTSALGCDSILTINLTVNNQTTNTINATACDSYTSPSNNYVWTTSGTYIDTLTNASGCDSVLTINLTINHSTANTISAVACDSYTSPSNNHTWTTSGTYTDTLVNSVGCDSVLTINLTINNSTSNTINATACNSYTSPSNNYTWTTSGTHMDTLVNAIGCDSVLTINLTINNPTTNTINVIACDSYTSPSTNHTWTTSGIYNDTLTNASGCDSILTINLTINNSTTNTINVTACDSYTSPSNNHTWTTSGTYIDTLTNASGCDSVLTVNLTINHSTANTISAVACDSYTSPSNNHTWTTSGTYTDTLVNSVGCDSVLTINLTINNSTSNTINATACNSYTSPSNNYTWTTSGTYTDTLVNAVGCDSILTVNLTVDNPTTNTINVTACDSYTSPSNNYTWTTSGTYNDTLVNAVGCDSVLTINLTINTSPNVSIQSTTTAICNGSVVDVYATGAATYNWMPGNIANDTLPITYQNANTNCIVTGTDTNGCTDTAMISLGLSTTSGQIALAGTQNINSNAGIQSNNFSHPNDGQPYNYVDNNCNLITTVQEAMGGSALGLSHAEVHVEATPPVYQGQPYIARWYDITPTNQGAATVTLYYTDQDFINYNANNGGFPDVATHANNATVINNLSITKVSGGTLGVGTNTVHNVTGVWDSINSRWEVTLNIPSFSEFYLHTSNPGNAALGVSLKSFTVKKSKEGGMLSWITSQENNSSHFEIERSVDGINFETLGRVTSKAKDGISNKELNYQYMDYALQIASNYYRLKQVGLDDQYEYSEVRLFRWDENMNGVLLYPNPNKGQFTISVPVNNESELEVKVFDMSGRIVKTVSMQSTAGKNEMNVDVSKISNGIYYVQVLEDSQLIFTSKVRKE